MPHGALASLRGRRRWELTMYKVGRNELKKLFMGADEVAKSISKMRMTDPSLTAVPPPPNEENVSSVNDVTLRAANSIIRAGEKDRDVSIRASEGHVETISLAKGAPRACVHRLEMSPSMPFRMSLWLGSGGRRARSPRRSAAPDRRPPHTTRKRTRCLPERASARSARRTPQPTLSSRASR
jgi:hypothetical protein